MILLGFFFPLHSEKNYGVGGLLLGNIAMFQTTW